MVDQLHAYTGWEQRTYSAYLTPTADGGVVTLVGTPGMAPVTVWRAAGNEVLSSVPGDGLWAPVQQETAAKPSRKAAASPVAEAASG